MRCHVTIEVEELIRLVALECNESDQRGIVGACLERKHGQANTQFIAESFVGFAQLRIRSDPTTQAELARASLLKCRACFGNLHVGSLPRYQAYSTLCPLAAPFADR